MTTMTGRTRTRPLLDTRGASVAADTHVREKGEMGVLRVPDETRKGSNKAGWGFGRIQPRIIHFSGRLRPWGFVSILVSAYVYHLQCKVVRFTVTFLSYMCISIRLCFASYVPGSLILRPALLCACFKYGDVDM